MTATKMPKFILLKGSGHGLANLLFVLSTAISLSKKTGAKLVIDWENTAYGFGFWDLFTLIDSESFIETDLKIDSLNGLNSSQFAWEGQYQASVRDIYKQVSGKGEFAGLDLEAIPPMSGLKTYFEGQPQKDVLVLCGYHKIGQSPAELLKHLRLTKRWSDRLMAEIHTLPDTLRNGSYVGLHVRAAAGETFAQLRKKPLAQYLRKHPHLQLFLATDLASVEDELRSDFGSRMLEIPRTYATTPTSNTIEPLALHGIRDEELVHSGRLFHEAVRDIWLLSRSHTLYAQPRSTFSELATLFSSFPPWRLKLCGKSSLKYRLGAFYRSAQKYRAGQSSLLQE